MQKGIQLDVAIKIFDTKVKLKMKDKGLSEFAALSYLLYFNDKTQSLLFEKEYQNRRAVKQDPNSTIRNSLLYNDEYKTKKINEITLISSTEEGLKKLEQIVNYVYKKGNQQYLNKLSLEAKRYRLIVSDVSIDDSYTPYYEENYLYIFLGKSPTIEEDAELFYHETTHFLDDVEGRKNVKSKDSFSVNINFALNNIFEKIKSKVNILSRGLSLSYRRSFHTKEYINDPVLNQKWLEHIKKEYQYASSEDIKLYMQQKILYEMKKYKILIIPILDIYDGILGGKLFQLGTPGHGKKYYSRDGAAFQEFIANIGSIYNSDGIDILNSELGPELTSEIISIYENFIGNDTYNPQSKVV